MLWYDGKLADSGTMPFDFSDRGLLLGDGLFETLPAFNGAPFLLKAHLDRMMSASLRLGMPLDRTTLENAILALASADPSACVIRLTVTRGAGPRGLLPPRDAKPLVFATRAPWLRTSAFGDAKLITASIRRNATSPASSMKTLSYLDNVMGFQEAHAKGADDALFLTNTGHAVCTSMANLFMVNHNTLVTPPLDGNILPGIMRRFVLDTAASLGFEIKERAMTPADLLAADRVFATNSVRFVTRITRIDQSAIGNRHDEAFNRISDAVADQVPGMVA